MESLGLSQKDERMHSSRISGEGELRGQPANAGSPGKMSVKTECLFVCVCVCVCVCARTCASNDTTVISFDSSMIVII